MRLSGGTFFRLVLAIIWIIPQSQAHAMTEKKPNFDPVSVTILHTNDIHSHFRETTGPLKLGGLARLKTKIDQIRSEIPHTILVDAGDWSEGNIYYTQGTGVETLRLMDRMGYEVAVIGNHDFINGPDILLNTLESANPKIKFIAANLVADQFHRSEEFKKWVLPYVIQEVENVKIAFIGLTTYEFIYDKFALPLKITEPFQLAQDLASELKKHVDAVIAVSHNSTLSNAHLLKNAPAVDLVISGHEHKKLTKPIEVQREGGRTGWIVETESWGRYLGKLDIKITSDGVDLEDYRLLQIDSRTPEDPEILEHITSIEQSIGAQFGSLMKNQIGESHFELTQTGVENTMGNLVTDAYLNMTHADLALESRQFIYGEIHNGPLHSVDIFNAHPAVYNPATQKTWTLKTVPISGRALKWVLYLVYATKKLSSFGVLSASGMTCNYAPLFYWANTQYNLMESLLISDEFDSFISPFTSEHNLPVVQDILIQGEPLDLNRKYTMATGGGLIEAIEFIDKQIVNAIPLDGLVDTGKENWRVLEEYIHEHSPLTPDKVPTGERIRTRQSDLGIYDGDIEWQPHSKEKDGMVARVKVRIKNYGLNNSLAGSVSNGPRLHIFFNKQGIETGIDPDFQELATSWPIPSLAPGESTWATWDVILPEIAGMFPVTFKLDSSSSEVNITNKEVTHWFVEKPLILNRSDRLAH